MEKPGMIKMSLKGAVAALLLLLCFFSFSLPAQTSGNKRTGVHASMNIMAARQEIRNFEATLNEALQAFVKDFLGIRDNPRGAYLPEYGVNFTFAIDIRRAIINTPFGEVHRRQATAEQKRQRIEELKETLVRLLQDNGKKFQQLDKEDCVSIVAFIDDKNFLEPGANKTIVLRALKKDLDELGDSKDRLNEFKQRIKIVEY
jgi:hypothetical protein